MSIKRFGKSSAALLKQKKSFFEENKQHIERQDLIEKAYIQQPSRTACKNCGEPMDFSHKADLKKGLIEYFICDNCTHLNGKYEDTTEFCEAVYTDNSGKEYGKEYSSADVDSYNFRTSSVYIPKADFMYTTLIGDGVNPNDLEFLDFGSGSGYYVAAMDKIGLKNISGTEVSESQVELGNAMIGKNLMKTHKMEDTIHLLETTSAQVVSMVGVLEHLQNPIQALEAIQKNDNIKYYYISVPLFSLSVFIELLSPEVFHRHLGGGHTHLYTKESLQYIAKKYNFEIVGEWWFGADIVDLYRHCFVNLQQNKASEKMMELFKEKMIPMIDALQLEIDKSSYSSEVHMLFKK